MNFELSGHAMMLTNPLPSHLATNPVVDPHQPPRLPPTSLLRIMDSAQRLPLQGGEVPPILALRIIQEDDRYPLLTKAQFDMIRDKLKASSRCYGYVASFVSLFNTCLSRFSILIVPN